MPLELINNLWIFFSFPSYSINKSKTRLTWFENIFNVGIKKSSLRTVYVLMLLPLKSFIKPVACFYVRINLWWQFYVEIVMEIKQLHVSNYINKILNYESEIGTIKLFEASHNHNFHYKSLITSRYVISRYLYAQ